MWHDDVIFDYNKDSPNTPVSVKSLNIANWEFWGCGHTWVQPCFCSQDIVYYPNAVSVCDDTLRGVYVYYLECAAREFPSLSAWLGSIRVPDWSWGWLGYEQRCVKGWVEFGMVLKGDVALKDFERIVYCYRVHVID